MDDLVQVFRVSICPVPQKAQNRLAVITQDPFHFLAGTILIEVFFIADLLKKALDVLGQVSIPFFIYGMALMAITNR